MSSSDVAVTELGDDQYPLTLEGYGDDYYSSFWPSEVEYQSVLTFCEENPPTKFAEAIVRPVPDEKGTVPYDVVEQYLSSEVELLRINDREYNVTWQEREGMNQVGFISDEANPEMVEEFYQQTTGQALSSDEREELYSFLERY
ncbi:hypothetical protein [Natrinema sp. 1APR25-10V2]|uniref:hypothetical protein n=1 Tax=Natrinema sp. 1APR25-10V2 TaxID=2951081 RepID=UPI0028754CD3|nr:hypothetical protein [Natrinema sp. 1APR25-10V2]MDS0476818.1 hypothetical protein [Natrinema sp. 1APR25-10V2]